MVKEGQMIGGVERTNREEFKKEALQDPKNVKGKKGDIIVKNGLAADQPFPISKSIASAEKSELGRIDIDIELLKLIPPPVIRMHKVLPISKDRNTITLAMADPLNQRIIDDIRMATGLEVIPVLADKKDIEIAIRQILAFKIDPNMVRILKSLKQDRIGALSKTDMQLKNIDDAAPFVGIVNTIVIQAVQGLCSDIHIEPGEKDIRVRFRLDGELYEVLTLPLNTLGPVISRLKILASIDIAEKRVPQDGRIRMNIEDREVDFRVSTLPTIYGEKVVLRILDRENALISVDQLGLSIKTRERLLRLCYRPYGMILVTGPTGSGKTTTLYSILEEINSKTKNIITLEDPVEYYLKGINQVQINQKAGLNFASGLRFILRQDPDIIMVGEIRDRETAELTVQTALTGHLVFSTLHTNNASTTIVRLIDMGIENFLVAGSVAGIISQRLVRRLCIKCREKYLLDEEAAVRLGIPEASGREFYRPTGCSICRQLGYQGRIALQEIMVMGPRIRELIIKGETSEDVIEKAALEEGMVSIKQDGINKAFQGIVSLEEVMKAVMLEG